MKIVGGTSLAPRRVLDGLLCGRLLLWSVLDIFLKVVIYLD